MRVSQTLPGVIGLLVGRVRRPDLRNCHRTPRPRCRGDRRPAHIAKSNSTASARHRTIQCTLGSILMPNMPGRACCKLPSSWCCRPPELQSSFHSTPSPSRRAATLERRCRHNLMNVHVALERAERSGQGDQTVVSWSPGAQCRAASRCPAAQAAHRQVVIIGIRQRLCASARSLAMWRWAARASANLHRAQLTTEHHGSL